ncbi:NUDIX hydrolase [Actinokineospora spheciospongiae]|uniref:NUDIX hydrolase n=1 Tax=Actinokineospora spheciospongiae TaxID=909613 RepID=UPI000D710DC3|nr:NUDIX hydrolase [Actinokineospora spheciospongiae]
MEHVQVWTGEVACRLQEALRLTNEGYARRLGMAVRTVANWRANPDLKLSAETQQILDRTLAGADREARARFFALQNNSPIDPSEIRTSAQTLTVAIAVVTKGDSVLIVQRRGEEGGGISWQFPAGFVKPGIAPEMVAIRETYGETGVHCSATRRLGSRIHPITHVLCEYVLCDYLSGEPENRDPAENVSVTWALNNMLTRFIPSEHIFPPVLEVLGGPKSE